MIEIEIEADGLQAANFVANNTEILTVKLSKCLFVTTPPKVISPDLKLTTALTWGTFPHVILGPGKLSVTAGIHYELSPVGETKKSKGHSKEKVEPIVRIELQYEVIYQIPSEPVPEPIEKLGGLAAFARWNSLFNCWPFFREEIRRLLAAADLQNEPIPLLKFKPKKKG